MADVTNIDNVEGTDLTEAQIKGFIRQIDINIWNLIQDKSRLAPYEAGDVEVDHDKAIAELRATREMYVKMLTELPAIEYTVYDDPDV